MRPLYLLLCFLVMVNSAYPRICVNEVMQSNVNGIMDDYNEFPDSWVELYNDDSVAFDFTEYSISPSKDFTESYPLMDTTLIPAKGYLLFYCDKEEYGGRHANFRLDPDGLTLYIFDPVGHIVDSLDIPEMLAPNISYGRISDGADSLSWFKVATPATANTGFYSSQILKKPAFSIEGGLYSEPVSLHLSLQGSHPSDAVIRYTINGSEPTENSPIAPDTIFIRNSTVIKAKTFSDSALSKMSKTESYLLLGRETNLPILSLSLDSVYLWDDEIGIYTEGTYGDTHPNAVTGLSDVLGKSNYVFSWRRPVTIEYFKNNNCELNQLCEFHINGNSNRLQPLKSFTFKSNERFGEKRFSNVFWTDKTMKKIKSFQLRNSSQDFGLAYLRDAVMQKSMGRKVNLDWEDYQPTILFVNGEYWGLINIREKTTDDYIWANYNHLEDIDLIMFQYNVLKGDHDAYYNTLLMYEFYAQNGIKALNFEDWNSIVDVDEFLNYFIINSIYANNDFPTSNRIFWRERSDSAKWRFFAKDLDLGWGMSKAPDYHYLNYLLRVEPFEQTLGNNEPACALFKRMVSFNQFKNQLIDRFAVYLGTFLNEKENIALLDSLAGNIEGEIPYFFNSRFVSRDESTWYSAVDSMRNWYKKRVPFFYNDLHEFFSLGDTVALTIHTDNPKQLYFNGIKLDKNNYEGRYFRGRPFYLSRNDSAFAYSGDTTRIFSTDSVRNASDGYWYVHYVLNGEKVLKLYPGKSLFFTIPDSASNVVISDTFFIDIPRCDSLPLVTKRLTDLDCGIQLDSLKLSVDVFDSFGDVFSAHLDSLPDSLFIGTSYLKWTYADAFGDTLICNQQVEIQGSDSIAFDKCNSLDTLRFFLTEKQSSIDSVVVRSYRPIATGYCGLKYNGELNSKEEYKVGVDSLSWIFTNEYGDTLTCPQVVEVLDTIKPVLENCDSLPILSFYLTELSCGLLSDTLPIPVLSAKDNLDSVIIGIMIAPDTVSIGLNDVTWKFIDASNNELLCHQQWEVVDKCAPICFDCGDVPDTVYFYLKENTCEYLIDSLNCIPLVAYDNCGTEIQGTLLPEDSILPIGVNTLHWSFADDAGNVSIYNQTVIVKDVLPPVIDCSTLPISLVSVDEDESVLEELKFSNPVALDNCETPIYGTISHIDSFQNGINEINWIFMDSYGNQSSCSQKVLIADYLTPNYDSCSSMPVVLVNITDNQSSLPMSAIHLSVPVAEKINGYTVDDYSRDTTDSLLTILSLTGVTQDVYGTLFSADSVYLGDNSVYWIFKGESGYPKVCEQLVRVRDSCSPIFDCNGLNDITVDLNNNDCGVTIDSVPFVTPYAEDNSGVVIPGVMVDSLTFFPIGDNVVLWRFEDYYGNLTICPQSVAVVDNFPPVANCASLDTVKVDLTINANEIMKDQVPLQIPYATDNCGNWIAGSLTSEKSFSIGDNCVQWTFVDASGNTSMCTQTITAIKHFKVTLYPNPTNGYLCVEGVDVGDKLSLTNSLGQVACIWTATGNPTILNLSPMADGVYMLNVKGEIYKIIKE